MNSAIPNPRVSVRLTNDRIPSGDVLPPQAHTHSGGTVAFLGTAREYTDGRQTASLEYEAYESMAIEAIQQLVDDACQKWPIVEATVIHRLGSVPLGETCVAIVVSCPHRREAFEATSWLMDQIKQHVPIWKKEHWSSGNSQWVHPDEDRVHPNEDAAE